MNQTRTDGGMSLRRWVQGAILVAAFGLWVGCQSAPDGVESVLEGQITVNSSVDSVADSQGFRVLVVQAQRRRVDTLAHAITDREGNFRMRVSAPERGIYPLMIWGRQGTRRLSTVQYVVAEGDSARLQATLPLEGRRVQIQSPENNALTGYQNAMAQHRRTLLLRLKGRAYDATVTAQGIRQTSSVLWELQNMYPGTYAAEVAMVEALSLLEGRNDSLVVSRVQSIAPSNPRYVEAVQIGRRAAARWKGQDAALTLLDSLETRATTPEQRAGIQAVRVRAHIDSLEEDAALQAAATLRSKYPDTRWAEWADRAQYEGGYLLPGREAPDLAVRTLRGDSLSLRDLRGRPVVLEFYDPGMGLYARQLPTRNTLYQVTRPDSVAFVSVSTEPDTVLTRAFLSNRSLPGHRVVVPGDGERSLAKTYNVVNSPVRFLIDAQGRVVRRYEGTAFLALQDDLMTLLDTTTTESIR